MPGTTPTPTPDSLLAFLRRVMEAEFELDAEEVRPEARLLDDLGLDSVDAMVLALRVEEETGLELSDDELKELDTVASVVALVHQRLAGRPVPPS
jgi:acyl carrier protein